MAFNHRKLILDPGNLTLIQLCASYCDPTRNDGVSCPDPCIGVCYPICSRPFFSEIPPPPDRTTTISYNPPNKHHKLPLLLDISLAVLAITFFVFCCYTFYKCYTVWYGSRRRSQPQQEETHDDFLDEDHGPVVDHPIWYIRTVGLQPSVISAITICKYKRGDGLVEGTDCSVCLNEFQEDETLRLLPKCNHAFHIPCIDTWLRSHTNCPMCRARIVTSMVGSPSLEESVENSGLLEETQVGIPVNNGESGREREDEACELRVRIVEEGELRVENGMRSTENSKEEGGSSHHLEMDEVQPIRRSVSLDSSSASMISLAITNAHLARSDGNSDTQLAKVNGPNMGNVPKRVDVNKSLLRLVGSSSIGRSLQKGPISIKRSVSYSGKVLLSRYSQSRNSVLRPS